MPCSAVCKDRVVIITGAGGGLGAAYAKALAAEGAKVVVNDINAAAAQTTVDAIKTAGGEAIANTSDITNYDDSANAVKQAIECGETEYGRTDHPTHPRLQHRPVPLKMIAGEHQN